jgi:hypothetical protein
VAAGLLDTCVAAARLTLAEAAEAAALASVFSDSLESVAPTCCTLKSTLKPEPRPGPDAMLDMVPLLAFPVSRTVPYRSF